MGNADPEDQKRNTHEAVSHDKLPISILLHYQWSDQAVQHTMPQHHLSMYVCAYVRPSMSAGLPLPGDMWHTHPEGGPRQSVNHLNIVLGKSFHTSKEVCKVKPLLCVDFEQALQEVCDLSSKVTKGGGGGGRGEQQCLLQVTWPGCLYHSPC